MKICPKCGSVIADYEVYCENCGFDPDYDMGSWRQDTTSTKLPYYHGEHIKKPDPYVLGKEVDWILFAITIAFLIFAIFIPFYNTNNFNMEIVILIDCFIVFIICYAGLESSNNSNKSTKFNIDNKKSEKIKKTYSEKRFCPNCGKEVNKRAIRCKYCNYYFKDKSVKVKCKICGNLIDVDLGVCEYCGYEIGPMKKFKK